MTNSIITLLRQAAWLPNEAAELRHAAVRHTDAQQPLDLRSSPHWPDYCAAAALHIISTHHMQYLGGLEPLRNMLLGSRSAADSLQRIKAALTAGSLL